MPKFSKYCVQFMWRVEDDKSTGLGLFIEQLRYAGVLYVVKEDDFEENTEGLTPTTGTNGVYRLYPPIHYPYSTGTWAQQNAERMKSFGINAEVVPMP